MGARATSELNLWWRLALAVLGPPLRLMFRLRCTGLERVPTHGPAVLAANHLSPLDGIFLPYVVGSRRSRTTRYLVAAEFFERRFHGFWLRTFRQIPIRRGEGDAGALDEAVATVRSGAIAGIFPEGRVNPQPEASLMRGRTGVARIALAAAAPVVPVGIWGTQARWPRSGLTLRRPFRPAVALSFGEPIEPKGDPASQDDVDVFTDLVMTDIAKQVAEARALAAGGR